MTLKKILYATFSLFFLLSYCATEESLPSHEDCVLIKKSSAIAMRWKKWGSMDDNIVRLNSTQTCEAGEIERPATDEDGDPIINISRLEGESLLATTQSSIRASRKKFGEAGAAAGLGVYLDKELLKDSFSANLGHWTDFHLQINASVDVMVINGQHQKNKSIRSQARIGVALDGPVLEAKYSLGTSAVLTDKEWKKDQPYVTINGSIEFPMSELISPYFNATKIWTWVGSRPNECIMYIRSLHTSLALIRRPAHQIPEGLQQELANTFGKPFVKSVVPGSCIGFSKRTNGIHSSIVPSFYILGSQKAGTTDLFKRIVYHSSDLATARLLSSEADYMDKELHFFEQGPRYGKGLPFYIKHFHPCSCFRQRCSLVLNRGEAVKLDTFARTKAESEMKVSMDATPNYFCSIETPFRMRAAFGNAYHLINHLLILRDPVERAISWYHHIRRHEYKFIHYYNMTLAEALDSDLKVIEHCMDSFGMRTRRASNLSWQKHLDYQRCLFSKQANPLLAQGLYGDLIDWWLRFFEKKQFMVFLLDDYKLDPSWVETKTLSHLNLFEGLVAREESENKKIFNKNPDEDKDDIKSSSPYIRSKMLFKEAEWKMIEVLSSLPYFFNLSDTG